MKKNSSVLLIVLGIFILSRALTLTAFPIFNDEAIYLQYSQAIHDDWQRNKFISMHGEWTDWKPPLQYWMAATVIERGNDPLVAGRAVSLFVSVLGLVGFYLFAKEFFGPTEALVTGALYVICPPVWFQNNQFTAETFLFSTTPFFYLALLRMIEAKRCQLVWAMLGVVAGTVLLLFKQSGSLLLALGIILPLAQLAGKGTPPKELDRRKLGLNFFYAALIIAGAHVMAALILPGQFAGTREHFNSRWVMSVLEILDFPTDVWGTNLGIVTDYIGANYSWIVLVLVGVCLWVGVCRKGSRELTLALMCLAGGLAVIFLLRQFNEYIFNTAIIAVLLPLLARIIVSTWKMEQAGKTIWLRSGLLVCVGIMLVNWGYQVILMSISPGKYIERNTPWAVTNYLKSWSTGFGMKEVVALLEKEKRPGVLFADTQWGNPLTTLQVYGRTRFPNLRIVPVSKEFLDPVETQKLREAAKQIGEVHLAVFSADPSGDRRQWQRNLEQQMCERRQQIRAYPEQTPIIVCHF